MLQDFVLGKIANPRAKRIIPNITVQGVDGFGAGLGPERFSLQDL